MPDIDLANRLFEFAVIDVLYLRKLNNSIELKVIKNQLIKSSSSSAANYEESHAASLRADFKNKINISLKEMRESNFWIRFLSRINKTDEELIKLTKESEELKKILGAIHSKIKVK